MVRRLERYDGFAVTRTSQVTETIFAGYSFLDLEPMQGLQGRSDMTFAVRLERPSSVLDRPR